MAASLTDKAPLRSAARAARNALEAAWRTGSSAAIARRILDLPELPAASVVTAYVSIGSEVETRGLLRSLIELKGAVALPRLDAETGLLEHYFVEDPELGGLVPGPYGIFEPPARAGLRKLGAERVELALMPGLAFDRTGGRLGMGAGHYDRFLARSRPALLCGLAFSCQLMERIPMEAHDVRVDAIATELELVRVRTGGERGGDKPASDDA